MPHVLPPSGGQPLTAEQIEAIVNQEMRELVASGQLTPAQLDLAREELLRDLVVEQLTRTEEIQAAQVRPADTVLKAAFVAWVRKDDALLQEQSLAWLRVTSGVALGQAVKVLCCSDPLEMLLQGFTLDFGGGPRHTDGQQRLKGVTLLTDKQGFAVRELTFPLSVKLQSTSLSEELGARVHELA